MSKLLSYRVLLIALPALLALSACGLNMSGEPEAVSEVEIRAVPTALPTQPPADAPAATAAPEIPESGMLPGLNVLRDGLALAQSTATPSLPDVAATLQQGVLTVRGRLIQGTADGDPIPPDLPVQLLAWDVHGTPLGAYDTTADANGVFVFEGVPRGVGNMYVAWLEYDGVPQGTQTPPIEGTEDVLTADVTIYEKTDDPASVVISWAQLLLNYAPISQDIVEVRLDLELINTGDRIVMTGPAEGKDWPVSVQMELPVGAVGIQPMQAENSARYQVELVGTIPVVYDTWPLRPAQLHKITVLYYLPYENGAVFDQAFGYPITDAAILLPNDTVTFESEQFDSEGAFKYRVLSGGLRVSPLEEGAAISQDDITLIRAHSLLAPLGTDARMIFTLMGRPTRTIDVMPPTPQAAQPESSSSPLPYILAGAGGFILALAGVLWWRSRGAAAPTAAFDGWKMPDSSAGKDALLKALAALEDAYDAGEIDEDTYLERREALKDRLLPLMDEDDHA